MPLTQIYPSIIRRGLYMTENVYEGSCHCGFILFSIHANIDHLRICDCSVCHKRGAMMFRISADRLLLHRPLSDLNCYRWGSRSGADYFCPHCGILPFRKPSALTTKERSEGQKPFTGWAINVLCLDGIDISTLPQRFIRGSQI